MVPAAAHALTVDAAGLDPVGLDAGNRAGAQDAPAGTNGAPAEVKRRGAEALPCPGNEGYTVA